MAKREVTSEVAGMVWEVAVAAGQTVEAGEALMLVESMKMEIPIESPVAGKVVEIRVAKGDVVDEGQTVAVVE